MRILCNILVVLFVTATAVGQQINPVPDYIFRNSMSVGRNAPTDTSAYFSIGPRFGATRGFMPPMVTDTASVTGTKRNGLLIYSIQRNSFLYWDSTGMRWSRIAANLDTLLLSTRAWRQKGIDSLASVRVGGSGTTNYVPKFTASATIGNSKLFDDGTNLFYNQTTQVYRRVTGLEFSTGQLWIKNNGNVATMSVMGLRDSVATDAGGRVQFHSVYRNSDGDQTEIARVTGARENATDLNAQGYISLSTKNSSSTLTEAMRITSTQESLFGTTLDAGDFRVQVSGNQYVSGNVGIGGTPSWKLHVFAGSDIATSFFTHTGLNGGINISNSGTLAVNRDAQIRLANGNGANERTYQLINVGESSSAAAFTIQYYDGSTFSERFRINSSGESLFGTTTDAGDFRVQVSGNQYVSGESYFGTTTDAGDYRMQINGDTYANGFIAVDDITGTLLFLASFKTTTGAANTGPSIYFGAHNGLTSIDAGYIDLKKANGTLGNNETYMAFQTRNISTGLGERLRIKGDGETLIGYTADQGAYILQANGSGYFSGSLTTGAPTGGTAQPWKLGTVATVSPTSPNRTIEVEVNGTIYYLHAKTTND